MEHNEAYFSTIEHNWGIFWSDAQKHNRQFKRHYMPRPNLGHA